MTTTLAAPAVDAQAGRDLYRFSLAGQLSRSVADVTKLKKNSDGSVTIPDVDVLKTGEFNGLQLVDGDLMAMVDRFNALRESVFVPPFRLDHSWSIYDVIGWFDQLSTYQRVDESDGEGKTFLRAEIRLTGSVGVGVDALLAAIKAGALNPRSSEIGYYRTNAGVEYPMVFYGAAFVDIPAVEGLGQVQLSKLSRRPQPHSITNLNSDERSPEMPPSETTPATETTPAADATAGAASATTTDSTSTSGEQTPATETAPAASTTAPAAAPAEGETDLARAQRQIAALRDRDATKTITRLRSAGAIVKANEAAAEALLRHEDDAVRDHAESLLSHTSGVVKLNKPTGEQLLAKDGSGATVDEALFSLDKPLSEVTEQWTALSSDERKKRQGEFDKFMADRAAAGLSAGRGD